MAQARNPAGAGSQEFSATQILTDITWDTVPSTTNRLKDGVTTVRVRDSAEASADFVWSFVAEDNGVIEALRYKNGAVIAGATHGWELEFLNLSDSSAQVSYFGIGSNTEAAKATDVVTDVAAGAAAEIVNTVAQGFDKGDVVQVTADRDGTTIVGTIELVISYESEGTR